VSKLSYGYSRHSLPFSPPLFSGRILGDQPQRGDVVVFKLPSDDTTDYIKRVIGLPGDRIQMIGGILHINGEAVKREVVPEAERTPVDEPNSFVTEYRETLPNGVQHRIFELSDQGHLDNTVEYTVPPGHFFMMGDNRDNSLDSRANVGFVPFENLVGRAEIVFFSHNDKAHLWEVWKWPLAIRYGRLFDVID
ncbi:MAG: signal peptidase I, partial [Kiloniellales bacterium]